MKLDSFGFGYSVIALGVLGFLFLSVATVHIACGIGSSETSFAEFQRAIEALDASHSQIPVAKFFEAVGEPDHIQNFGDLYALYYKVEEGVVQVVVWGTHWEAEEGKVVIFESLVLL